MGYYPGLPEIRATITRRPDGSHYTTVVRNGVVVAEMETDPGQVRPERTSMLWRAGLQIRDETFKRETRKR
jgi:hypothetical protein